MGLKCSVLGHTYGEATVERDREEQGSEVVITIQEIETCERCGKERVVSENKEVTSIETPDDDVVPDDDVASEETADGDDEAEDETDEDLDEPSEFDEGDAEPAGDEADDDVAFQPPADAEADAGAEILDAEADEPVTDDELADPSVSEDPVAEPEVDDEADDAVIIDEEDEETGGDQGRQPGEWPEEPADEEDGWAPDTSDLTDASESTDEETRSAVTVPDGQFRCPECGYTTAVESSSLRAGDFCPDCRTGTLVHEAEDPTRKE